jgi:hypothetical protein
VEFLMVFNQPGGLPLADSADGAALDAYAGELRARGVLKRRIALAPASTAVQVRDGAASVVDSPAFGATDGLAGVWVIDVADRAAAIALAEGCPPARRPIELHALQQRHRFADPHTGPAFLLAFRSDAGPCPPGSDAMRAMVDFAGALARDGICVETAPLGDRPPAARVAASGTARFVTDGPFAETKDVIGGYTLLRVADRAAAIALAVRYPHARWGVVEVRQVRDDTPL